MKKVQHGASAMMLIAFFASCLAAADEPVSGKSETAFRPVLNAEPAADRPDKLVKVKVYPLYNKLVRGERCLVALELTVKDGWHINANPAKPKFTIATEVKLKSKQKVTLKNVKFPKHTLHQMRGETEPYHVYDGKVYVYLLLVPDADETAKRAQLEFQVKYQACNDEQCIRPQTEVIRGTMSLADPDEELELRNADKFTSPKKGKAPEPKQ